MKTTFDRGVRRAAPGRADVQHRAALHGAEPLSALPSLLDLTRGADAAADGRGRIPAEVLHDLRRSLGVLGSVPALDHPEHSLGPWDDLGEGVRTDLRSCVEVDARAGAPLLPSGGVWTGLVRACWYADRALHTWSVERASAAISSPTQDACTMARSTPGLGGTVVDARAYSRDVKIEDIQPGEPIQNSFGERFLGSFGGEGLGLHGFLSPRDAREVIEGGRKGDNLARPHASLGNPTPTELVINTSRGFRE